MQRLYRRLLRVLSRWLRPCWGVDSALLRSSSARQLRASGRQQLVSMRLRIISIRPSANWAMVRLLGSGFAYRNYPRTCLITVLSIFFSGCGPFPLITTPTAAVSTPSPITSPFPSTATPEALDEHVREAFRVEDPNSRREAVLEAVGRFLRDDGVRNLSDADASLMLTQIAFSSERLVLTDAALIARVGEQAVVGLPDGLGLYLYDLGDAGAAPLELSRWTVGLSGLQASWGETEVGVVYTTLGNDGAMQAHFALAVRESEWAVAWISDETPDWWFNTRND